MRVGERRERNLGRSGLGVDAVSEGFEIILFHLSHLSRFALLQMELFTSS